MSVRTEIITQMQGVAEEQNKSLGNLNDDLPLLESGLDSLCLAVLIARLEDALGVDPFSTADEAPFPVTVGDLIKSYENALS